MPKSKHRRPIAPRTLAALAAGALTAVGVTASVAYDRAASASGCASHVRGDFNGDGHADVVVSEATRTVSSAAEAGAFRVLSGTSSGITTSGNRYFDASTLGTAAAPYANLGWSVAPGFFNADCYADLAVGVPGGDGDAGEVIVLYGSATGLNSSAQTFSASAVNPGTTTGDNFGYSLAVGDFNHDGYDDLAAGAPGDRNWAGAVGIIPGSSTGLTNSGGKWLSQDSPSVPGGSETGDEFGFSVAAGDFNGDLRSDLAVGVPYEDVNSATDTGTVDILLGSSSGITTTGSQSWNQGSTGVVGSNITGDLWGYALAAGDVTKDGKADLIVGAPGKTSGGASHSGSISVLRGTTGGLTGSKSQHFAQDTAGVPGTSETNDQFGTALTVGDFNGNGYADVAIGMPSEAIGSDAIAGSVTVMYGASSGLTTSGSKSWSQNTSGIAGAAETHDDFGNAVVALNVTSASRADLVIGVAGETTSTFANNGALAFLKGSSSGITATGSQAIGSTGLVNGAQDGHLGIGFGSALG